MSRATTTPARTGLPTPTASRLSLAASQSGLPTPSRRPRSSLGPNNVPAPLAQDPELQSAFKDVMKRGPRPSISSSVSDRSPPISGSGPRTPAARARTPSLYQSQNAPSTPGARPMLSSRPSLGPSTPGQTGMFTPRRPVRPESRASVTSQAFKPQVGDAVRMSNMGSEGILRFVGETDFKDGVWAGVELGGGFKGKGKNDGSVNGQRYFDADPDCGVFVLYSKLSPPTVIPSSSRPASVASSHRSNLSISGRATPSGSQLSVSRASSRFDDEPMPTRLMSSTASSSSSALTEGSRASRLANMTAKQLLDREKLPASTSALTTTPRASRVASTRPRQSFGTAGFSTPKAKPSASTTNTNGSMMPPPPSPSQFKALDEVRDLRARNAELEERLKAVESDAVRARASSRASLASRRIDGDEMAELRATLEDRDGRIGELESLVDDVRAELSAAKASLEDAVQRAEGLGQMKEAEVEFQALLDASRAELEDLKKEMKVQEERLVGELEAGMDRKRQEVAKMEARALVAEAEVADLKAFADELTDAGQATISLYEAKLADVNSTRYDLENTVRALEEKLAKATAPPMETPSSPATAQREATTAAEIDNENLTAQVKHLQNKLTMLEDELEEVRMQAINDAKAADARIARSKEADKAAKEEVVRVKEEKEGVVRDGARLRVRIGELEGALKENAAALEGARAEIEGLRVEVTDTESLRAGLRAGPSEEEHAARVVEITELKSKLQAALDEADARKNEIDETAETAQEKISALESEIMDLQKTVADLRRRSTIDGSASDRPSTPAQNDDISDVSSSPVRDLRNSTRKPRSSAGGADADKSLRGFQHIIQELTNENAKLKKTCEDLKEENRYLASDTALLRDEMKALEETLESSLLRQEGELDGQDGASSAKELEAARAAAVDAERKNQRAISLLNRELAELESLVESKIYREAELESTISDLQRSNDKLKASAGASSSRTPATSTSKPESASNATERCELCEGDHDLDACPVFSGNLDNGSPLSYKKDKVWCQDCESSQHRTEDCPLAEDVF